MFKKDPFEKAWVATIPLFQEGPFLEGLGSYYYRCFKKDPFEKAWVATITVVSRRTLLRRLG